MPSLFKRLLTAIIFFLSFLTQMPGGFSNSIDVLAENEVAIKNVVKGAIEDTRWMNASSRQEMNRILGAYYTGPLLAELSESAWNFTRLCTDWEYTTRADNCQIISLLESSARISVDILETEATSGTTYVRRAEYSLLKTENGWKAVERKLLPEETD